MRRDVISAYAASGAKILSWVIVSGLVYRFMNVAEFAMLALIRGTIGILNYTTFGLSPAMIRMVAETRRNAEPQFDETKLGYYTPEPPDAAQKLYANGLLIALITGIVGAAVAFVYAGSFENLYHMPDRLRSELFWPVLWIGLGTALRLTSDAPGSMLQAHDFIAKDNWRLVEAEAVWVLLAAIPFSAREGYAFSHIAFFYTVSGAILFLRRSYYAQRLTRLWLPQWKLIDGTTLKRLLSFGSLVLFAQLADYLYAPTDYILINRLLGWEQVAVYTPAMQIDAGLLLLVTGLSSVMLPKTALAHTAGDMDRVRRYYLYGTAFSAFLLLFAGVVVWIGSPLIFKLWLGDPMRATQAILPLVLIHTIVGGSSAVGRSILLGMGRVRAFTIAVLIAGAANVVLSYIFVARLHLGIKGIIYGTLIAVIARCAIWMPWYILRVLRRGA